MREAVGFIKKLLRAKLKAIPVKDIANSIVFIVVYGLMLNYAFSVLIGSKLAIETFPAYGLAWYFAKYELPTLYFKFRWFKR